MFRTGGRRTLGDCGVGVATANKCCRSLTLAGPSSGGGAGEIGGDEVFTGARREAEREGANAEGERGGEFVLTTGASTESGREAEGGANEKAAAEGEEEERGEERGEIAGPPATQIGTDSTAGAKGMAPNRYRQKQRRKAN